MDFCFIIVGLLMPLWGIPLSQSFLNYCCEIMLVKQEQHLLKQRGTGIGTVIGSSGQRREDGLSESKRKGRIIMR